MRAAVLEARSIVKEFSGVRVLHGVNLAVQKGEVHAVIGENGAGKTTLMRILAGFLSPSAGELFFKGARVGNWDVQAAKRLGVVMIHQELSLAEDLTVEESIFLGEEMRKGLFLDSAAMRRRTDELLKSLDTPIEPGRRVSTLSIAQKQMVEIAKAVSRQVEVLVMDEPTSVLTQTEVGVLFGLIRRLQSDGVCVVYVSHKLDEVKQISDNVTVLRDGCHIVTEPAASLSEDKMATLMVGRELKDMYPPKEDPASDETVLAVEDISVPGRVHKASFTLRRGEILGFAGLVGAGRTELMEAVLGLRTRSGGRIYRRGVPVAIHGFDQAIEAGLVYLPEDRKSKGLLVRMGLRQNLTLMCLARFCHPFIDVSEEYEALRRAIERFDIRAPAPDIPARNLSGGNQQKLVLAKIMQVNPEVVILDEPTRGIDVGTKRQIYYLIQGLVANGKSCIIVSSELQELIGVCHRIAVMRSGVVTGILSGGDMNEAEIMRYATGLKGVGRREPANE